MAKVAISTKRLQIDKANMTIIVITAIATFVTVFSLVASRALLSQRAYQAKVISKKEVAKKQLQENVRAAEELVVSYKAFVGSPSNILGGSATGQGDRDGDNAKIILDALPSKYDFPALTTSLEKLAIERNYTIVAIKGVDDELAQTTAEQNQDLKPVEMPFSFSVEGDYATMQGLVEVFERSIRPFNITVLQLSGDDKALTLTTEAKTFYQPEKGLSIKKEVIK
jgi:hypothetical protein